MPSHNAGGSIGVCVVFVEGSVAVSVKITDLSILQPNNLFLGIHPIHILIHTANNTSSPISALFVIVKKSKQPNC